MKLLSQRILDALLSLQGITGLAALSFLMYIGSFSRYWADDFCYIVVAENADNIFEAMQVVYLAWSNRYTNILFVGGVQFFGQDAIRFFPGIMIASLALSLFLMALQLGRFLEQPTKPLAAANLAMLLTFFTILQTPNRFQSVYWMMGLVTYFAPIIFLGLMVSLMLWGIHNQPVARQSLPMLGLLVLLALLSGGLSETTLAFQITFFALAFLAAFFFRKNSRRQAALIFSGVALAASLLSLVVVFLAPGNSVRLEKIPESNFSFSNIPLIFTFSLDFIWNNMRSFTVPAVISVLSAFGLTLATFRDEKVLLSHLWLALGVIPLIAYILIASLVAPSVYVYGNYGYPEPRALFPAQFVLTTAFMVVGLMLGWLVASLLRRHGLLQKSLAMITTTLILIAVSAYPLWFLQKEIWALPQTQRYARQWDQRNTYLREQQEQGNLDIVLDGIQPPGGLIDLRQSPNFWVNLCIADFYNLNSIAVLP